MKKLYILDSEGYNSQKIINKTFLINMHISTLLIKFIGITKFLQVFREVSCKQKPMKVAKYPRKPNYMYLHKIQHNVFRGV